MHHAVLKGLSVYHSVLQGFMYRGLPNVVCYLIQGLPGACVCSNSNPHCLNALPTLVLMIHECSLVSHAAFKHHVDSPGLFPSQRIAMMHECSRGELLTRAAFVHHDD